MFSLEKEPLSKLSCLRLEAISLSNNCYWCYSFHWPSLVQFWHQNKHRPFHFQWWRVNSKIRFRIELGPFQIFRVSWSFDRGLNLCIGELRHRRTLGRSWRHWPSVGTITVAAATITTTTTTITNGSSSVCVYEIGTVTNRCLLSSPDVSVSLYSYIRTYTQRAPLSISRPRVVAIIESRDLAKKRTRQDEWDQAKPPREVIGTDFRFVFLSFSRRETFDVRN